MSTTGAGLRDPLPKRCVISAAMRAINIVDIRHHGTLAITRGQCDEREEPAVAFLPGRRRIYPARKRCRCEREMFEPGV